MNASNSKVWIYARINNFGDENEIRLDLQVKELKSYAETKGYVIAGVSKDISTGVNYERSGLNEVLNAASENRMDIVLVKKFDQIGRDLTKTIEIGEQLEKQGVRIECLLEENEFPLVISKSLRDFAHANK